MTDNSTIEKINLQQFCGEDYYRPDFRQPFRYKGHVYATDGRALVRVDDDPAFPSNDKIAVEKVVPLDAPREYLKAPRVDLPEQKPAKVIRCGDCDGRGKEHVCPDCSCSCETCDGKGTVKQEPEVSTTLMGQLFDVEYLRMVYSLPDLEIAPNALRSDGSPIREPLFFRFAGGVGALMPLERLYETHVDIVGVAS